MSQLDWFLQQNFAGQFVGSRNQINGKLRKNLKAQKTDKMKKKSRLQMFPSKDFLIRSCIVAGRQTDSALQIEKKT